MLSANFTDLGKRGRCSLLIAWAGDEDTIGFCFCFCFFLKERWTQTRLNGAPRWTRADLRLNVASWTGRRLQSAPEGGLRPGRDQSDERDADVDAVHILETSGNALKADEWKQAEHIQGAFSAGNLQGRAHSYCPGHGRFRTGSHSSHWLLDLLSDAKACSYHAVDSPLRDQPRPPVLPTAVIVSLLQKYAVPTGSLHPVRFWSSEQQRKDPVVGLYDFWKTQFPLNQRLANFHWRTWVEI